MPKYLSLFVESVSWYSRVRAYRHAHLTQKQSNASGCRMNKDIFALLRCVRLADHSEDRQALQQDRCSIDSLDILRKLGKLFLSCNTVFCKAAFARVRLRT